MGTDMAKLMYGGKTTQDSVITHMYVSGQGRIVGQDHMIADHAVVRHMSIGHEQIMTADTGQALILHCPAVNRHTFTKNIVITHFKSRRFAGVLLVLAFLAN
jgi:hypothetical protein